MRSILLERQGPDGGWGAGRDLPADTESTALALLALSFATRGPQPEVGRKVALARAWLRDLQRTDGAWPHSDAVPIASWMTALASISLARFPEDLSAAEAGARWLLEQEGRRFSWFAKLMIRIFPERKAVELDPDLTGWPWLPDTFSWIEPTSYALIALKTLRPRISGRRTRARIDEAERMIFDRACADGGWNYGNSLVLGEELWAYPDTTALALIALQDVTAPEEQEKIGRALSALDGMVRSNDSLLVRSLAVLALQLYGQDTAGLRAEVAGRMLDDAPEETRVAAFAALALVRDSMPLQVPWDG